MRTNNPEAKQQAEGYLGEIVNPINRRTLIQGAVAAPLVLTARKASAQAPLDFSTLQSLAVAANGLFSPAGPNFEAHSAMCVATSNLQTALRVQGLDALAVANVPPTITSQGVQSFSSGFLDTFGLANWLSIHPQYFAVESTAEPTAQQVVVPHQTTFNYSLVLERVVHMYSLVGMAGGASPASLHLDRRRSPHLLKVAQTQRTVKVTKEQADVAIASGAALIGGGVALTTISGVTYGSIATASVGALSLFTLGAAAVVVGLGIAGYYGYQFLSQFGSGGPVSSIFILSYYPGRGFLPL